MKFLISGTTNQVSGFAKQIITNQKNPVVVFFDWMNGIFMIIKNPSKKSCPILSILSNFYNTSRMGMRPLDSAGAPLGVTRPPAVIPTGVTNGVRSGMEESHEEIFFDRMNGIFRIKNKIHQKITSHPVYPLQFFQHIPHGNETP